MSPAMRRTKLSKLCAIEGCKDENELFAAASRQRVSDHLLQPG
jgi:hypothetical protein